MPITDDPHIWEGTPFFLIKETISSSPLPLPGIDKVPGLAPGLNKLQRMVWQRHAQADVHFKGKPLGRQVGLYEFALEQILPGRQITTKRTGKMTFIVSYYGYLNIATAPYKLDKQWELFWVNLYGEDPIKDVRLYGNPDFDFVAHGGKGDPTAIAQYDGRSKKLTAIDSRNFADTIKKLKVD